MHLPVSLSLAVALAGLATAAAQEYYVSLDPAQSGGGARTGSGFGTLTLSGDTLTLNSVTYSGLSGNSTLAHIHGPAAPGANAGVLYNLGGLTTLGGTSGSFDGSVNLSEGTGGFTLAEQKVQLDSGLWYVNIHTTTFGGGEIRGQVQAVPEPTTFALLAGGFGALAIRVRKRGL